MMSRLAIDQLRMSIPVDIFSFRVAKYVSTVLLNFKLLMWVFHSCIDAFILIIYFNNTQ
jgi:hypothetical protein